MKTIEQWNKATPQERLVEAIKLMLRGEFAMIAYQLKNSDSTCFCFEGVFCELYAQYNKEHPLMVWTNQFFGLANRRRGSDKVMPKAVREWFGLPKKNYYNIHDKHCHSYSKDWTKILNLEAEKYQEIRTALEIAKSAIT
ncbi:MAG TPA: hypothetical protein VKR58_06115 [Aquella sp.]|nr:hypothetical protein [Aquella sp.]